MPRGMSPLQALLRFLASLPTSSTGRRASLFSSQEKCAEKCVAVPCGCGYLVLWIGDFFLITGMPNGIYRIHQVSWKCFEP